MAFRVVKEIDIVSNSDFEYLLNTGTVGLVDRYFADSGGVDEVKGVRGSVLGKNKTSLVN